MSLARQQKSQNAFRTISEVSDVLDVQQHVLRFWETKFTQVKPVKRNGGRRYYRPEDIGLLRYIHSLLKDEGYTIKGVQKLLKIKTKAEILQLINANAPDAQEEDKVTHKPMADVRVKDAMQARELRQAQVLRSVLSDLKDLKAQVEALKSAA